MAAPMLPAGGNWEAAVSMPIGLWRLPDYGRALTRPLETDGTPVSRLLFFPAEACKIIDTWDSIGLRGTGSHDYSVADVFVPAARSLSFREPPVEPGPLYAMPTAALLCSAPAAVSLGIARHAIDILLELAETRTISRSRGGGLRDDATVQASLGQAEALLRSGRAFLYKTLEELWRAVSGGRTLLSRSELSSGWRRHTRRIRPNRRQRSYSVRAVLPRYMRASEFERCVRDIHASAQHICVAPGNYQLAGQASWASIWLQACCCLLTTAACPEFFRAEIRNTRTTLCPRIGRRGAAPDREVTIYPR